MSPIEARRIIESLANGVDPETGEILPASAVFNHPQVIRALFVAVKALDMAARRDERDKALPSNAGRSWAEADDRELLSLFDAGTPLKEIARKQGRTAGAITARLVRHGRLQDRAQSPASAQALAPDREQEGARAR